MLETFNEVTDICVVFVALQQMAAPSHTSPLGTHGINIVPKSNTLPATNNIHLVPKTNFLPDVKIVPKSNILPETNPTSRLNVLPWSRISHSVPGSCSEMQPTCQPDSKKPARPKRLKKTRKRNGGDWLTH